MLPRSGPCEQPALPLNPQPVLPVNREHLGLRVGSSPAPPAQNKTQNLRAKEPPSLETREQSWPRTPRRAQCGPASGRSPAAPLPRRRHRELGRRLPTARGPRDGAGGRHKARRGAGGMEGEEAPAAPSRTARGLRRAGGASDRGCCVRPTGPAPRRGRAGASPRRHPLTCSRAGRELRRRFTTEPGGREAPHAAACSAPRYIYPARSLPQRARPSQSQSGARPHSDAGWLAAVRRRAER